MENQLFRRMRGLFFARPESRRVVTDPAGSHLNLFSLTAPVVALALVSTLAARADSYSFTISGTGISGSGVLDVTNTGPLPGSYTVTGISGTFSDSNNGISGAITGLGPTGPITFNGPGTYAPPGTNPAGLSYDNVFWPGEDSAPVCIDAPPAFSGGDFDIYGLLFDVADTYQVDLWSNGPVLGGYQLNESLGSTTDAPINMDGLAYAVTFNASATPEPGSLLLLGTGVPGLLAVARRRRSRAS